jgi:DNA repair photolyase
MSSPSEQSPPLFPAPRARGAAYNPPNRFEAQHITFEEPLLDDDGELIEPRTTFLRDDTQTILASNDSPDIPFKYGCSPYRGCEHGCAYCFARPFHNYLGFSAGIDFETKILVKERAPELLRAELSKRSWHPQTVAMSGITDVYQPVERRLRLTRQCLEVFAEFRNPVSLITKNHLITRDADVLGELAKWNATSVCISLTTLDADLQKKLEPRASSPTRRLDAIATLSAAGVPVRVLTAPIIPGITDHEIPALLKAAAQAGAIGAGYTILRLPYAVAPLFEEWLERHMPGHKDKVLGRIREMRGGKLYDAKWGQRMKGDGPLAEQIGTFFEVAKRRAGFGGEDLAVQQVAHEVTAEHFRVPSAQLDLFG